MSSPYKFYNGHTYQIITDPMTWSSADSYAKSVGAHLAIISSENENTFIVNNVKKTDTAQSPDGGDAYYVWLGASDLAVEGQWKWVDGTSLRSYSKWGSGSGITEPDNYDNQDGLALALSGWPYNGTSIGEIGDLGQWNDINVSNQIASVIEWDYITAQAHLSTYGVTIQQARDFIVANLSSPVAIYNTCEQYDVTNQMIVEIFDNAYSIDTVKDYFSFNGLNPANLDMFA